jgi:UDP-glucuronate decarboxylase
MAETMMYAYYKQHHLDIRVARIFNTYGPRMHPKDGRVVSNFIIQALQNHPITIYGDGSQTRSFQYVDDLVDGLIGLMESSHTSPMNLGNPEEYRVIDLAELIKEKTNSYSVIKYLPATVDDPMKRKPDIKTAQNTLKWTPKIPLTDGLEKTIEYFLCELVLVGDDFILTGQDPSKPNSYVLNSS